MRANFVFQRFDGERVPLPQATQVALATSSESVKIAAMPATQCQP